MNLRCCNGFLFQIFCFFIVMPGNLHAENLPIFPTAKGFGTMMFAGSGRHSRSGATTIFKINNLADKGPGSLRECLEAAMPRTCLFETSGQIVLEKPLRIKFPYLTLAGQSAPGEGIVLSGASLRVEAHDVLVQHLSIRVGDDPDGPDPDSRDAISIGSDKNEVYNVVLDHLSLSWAIDENLGTWFPRTRDITISNCIISEALNNSIHSKGPHSKGILIGDGNRRISIYGNLLAHNFERNPYFKPGSSGEFINNMVYNWGGDGGWNIANVSDSAKTDTPVFLNLIGNVFKPGADSFISPPLYGRPIAGGTRVFVSDNIGPGRDGGNGNDWLISSIKDEIHRAQEPVATRSEIMPLAASQVQEYVFKNAGSRPAQRNSVDLRVVNEARQGLGKIKDCLKGCSLNVGDWSSPPQMNRAIHLPANPDNDDNKNGYTNLEDWLHEAARKIE